LLSPAGMPPIRIPHTIAPNPRDKWVFNLKIRKKM
jgi:hypothetical protein